MSFEAILAGASLALAALVSLTSVIFRNASERASRRQRETLGGLRVDAVLAGATLKSVGDLIVRDLGPTSMPDYVRDTETRVKFRHAFNAARNYLGESPESEPEANRERTGAAQPDGSVIWGLQELSSEGRAALHDLGGGEAWNALARMRRALERALSARLEEELGAQSPHMGAGRLVAVAAKAGVIPSTAANDLRFSISTANRAIHGDDVSPDEALDAIVSMDRFIRSLNGSAFD